KKDNIVILVAESVAQVHPRIRQNSRLAAIDIPYPGDTERLEFIGHLRSQLPSLSSDVTDEQLALTTSGLNRVHLNSLLRSAAAEGTPLTLDSIRQKKKELIEAECVGLVEFVHPRFGLDSVGGMSKAKDFLRSIADTIRLRETKETPMGILIYAAAGNGK